MLRNDKHQAPIRTLEYHPCLFHLTYVTFTKFSSQMVIFCHYICHILFFIQYMTHKYAAYINYISKPKTLRIHPGHQNCHR